MPMCFSSVRTGAGVSLRCSGLLLCLGAMLLAFDAHAESGKELLDRYAESMARMKEGPLAFDWEADSVYGGGHGLQRQGATFCVEGKRLCRWAAV